MSSDPSHSSNFHPEVVAHLQSISDELAAQTEPRPVGDADSDMAKLFEQLFDTPAHEEEPAPVDPDFIHAAETVNRISLTTPNEETDQAIDRYDQQQSVFGRARATWRQWRMRRALGGILIPPEAQE